MAKLLPIIRFRVDDANGLPLVGGKVYTYQAGTTTPKASYTDSTGGILNANPVILDARGSANIWIEGTYKIAIYDANDVLIEEVDQINNDAGETGPAGTFQMATAGGTADAITADYTPNVTLTDKTTVGFVATDTNTTTSVTFSPDGLTPTLISKRGGEPLVPGDIKTTGAYILTYVSASGRWEMSSAPAKFSFSNSGFSGIIVTPTLTANRNYTLPDSGGSILIESGSYTITGTWNYASRITFDPKGASAGDGGSISFKELAANGTDVITFRAPDAVTGYAMVLPGAQGTGALTNDGAGNLSFQAAGSVFGPVGTSSGDGGRVTLLELAANGTDSVSFRAPDSIPTSYFMTLPSALPSGSGYSLMFNSTGVGVFRKSSGGIFNAFSTF